MSLAAQLFHTSPVPSYHHLPKPHMSSSRTLNIVVLISGSGTNLQALLDSVPTFENPHAQIVQVISNTKHAYGLKRAESNNPSIPTTIHSLASFRKTYDQTLPESKIRESYDKSLAKIVLEPKPDLIVLAGFMHILSEAFLESLNKVPVINLHPALPGCFDGANAIKRAWEAGPDGRGEVSETGVMIHEVIAEVDRGSPVVTRKVELRKHESLAELEDRMHKVEHELIVEGTRDMLSRIARSSHQSS
ncbi:formyl transferase [Melampsora americana]|nr:formyl transferase [Melampsora americana]